MKKPIFEEEDGLFIDEPERGLGLLDLEENEELKSKIYFRELEIDSLRKAIKTFEESNKLYKKVIKTLEKLLRREK